MSLSSGNPLTDVRVDPHHVQGERTEVAVRPPV